MLPAYVAYQLGSDDPRFSDSPLWARGARGLALGAMATLGFIVLFAAVGTVVSLGGRAVGRLFPWAALAIGAGLVGLGLALLTGRSAHVPALQRLRITGAPGWRGVFLFGIGYGLASLSCTLPIFLVVVGASVAAEGAGTALLMFVAYAAGMGAVLTAVTLGSVLFKDAVARFLRPMVPYVERISAVLLIGAGAYLVYYQWTGGLVFAR